MKKCPTCSKTFDDGLRFCQIDGTPLVDASAAVPDDPFKTIVGMPLPVKRKEEVSDLPDEPDFLKTMVSKPKPEDNAGFGGTMNKDSSSIVPLPDENSSVDTGFSQKSAVSDQLPMPDETGSKSPASPFDSKPSAGESSSSRSPFDNPGSPIPSPFDPSMPPRYETPSAPPFMEAEIKAEALNTPYAEQVEDQQYQPIQQSNWTPPPAPDASWQNQEIGQNTPFQTPAVNQGQNQTLAIVSLVCGILSMLCCVSVITGPAGLITGFMAKKNAEQNPNEYGGRSLALGGIITGAIGTLIFVVLFILQIFFGVLGGIMGNM